MLAAEWFKDLFGESYNFVLLGLIFTILGVGVGASLIVNRRDEKRAALVMS